MPFHDLSIMIQFYVVTPSIVGLEHGVETVDIFCLQTSDLGLTENAGDNTGYKFEIWFRKRTSNDTFVLQSQSNAVKNEWVREISRLLWKQAIKNRGRLPPK